MITKHLLATAITAALTVTSAVHADDRNNSFNFKAIDSSANAADWDATAPWKLPKGYTQTIVSDETNLNIYDGGRDDWHDMSTVNETGPMAGRFMYRAHELRYPDNQPEGGTVSVVDLKTGEEGFQTGFDSVDNLAEAPNGDLIMIEDNKPSDIWFASSKTNDFGASKKVRLFASLTDPEAEGTGIYFSPLDDKTQYVNVQHSAAEDGDATWAITRKGKGHRK